MAGCLNGAGVRNGLICVFWRRRVASLKMVRLVTGAGGELGQRKVFRKENLSLEAQFWQMSMGKGRLKRACTKRLGTGGTKIKRSRLDGMVLYHPASQ